MRRWTGNLPRYVQLVRSRGREYAYFRREGQRVKLPHPENHADFAAAYAEALRGTPPPPKGKTFAALIARYRRHRRFTKLKPRTQADYEKNLAYLERHHGPHEIVAMRRPDILRMQDAVSDRHGYRFANYLVQQLSILFRLGMDLGWIETNPASGVEMLTSEEDEMHRPWPQEVREAFERDADDRARLVYELCIGTGQRIGDVLAMKWEDIQDGAISVSQGKTGVSLSIPLTDRLAAFLRGVERRGVYILARDLRRPITYNMAQKAVAKASQGYTIHGLRYTAAADLAEKGCTDEEIAAITGHKSLAMIQKYAGKARQKARAKKAQEKRR